MISHFVITRLSTARPARLLFHQPGSSAIGVRRCGNHTRLVIRAWLRDSLAHTCSPCCVGTVILLTPGKTALLTSPRSPLSRIFPAHFAVAAVVAIWQLKHKQGDAPGWWRVNASITITGLFAIAVYLEVFPRADFYHLVRVLPPVFLFLFALLARWWPVLGEYLRTRVADPRRVSVLTLATPLLFLLLAGVQDTWSPEFDSGFHFRDNRELNITRGRGIFVEEKQAELTEGLVRLIQANSSPDDYIFSFAQRGSALYFLAARRNPTRFLWWRSVGISADEREGVMTMIADRRAKLIVVQDVAATQEIQDFIGDNYSEIGTVADIAVYGLR
jgi:hypothetical protein